MSCAAAHSAEVDNEADQRDLEQALASVTVAELAPQRRRCGGGHDVGGDHPRHVADVPQVAGDHRQPGGEDCLVEHSGQHRKHDRRERDRDVAAVTRMGETCGC